METKEALRFLRSVMAQEIKKPMGFNHGHLLLSVIFLGEKEVISRKEMKSLLGLGIGSSRSLMGRLALNHIAGSSASGFRMKPLGREIRESMVRVVQGPFVLNADYLRLDAAQMFYFLTAIGPDAVNPIRFRDLVVKYGGTGGTTCLLEKGKVKIAGLGEWLSDFSMIDEEQIMKRDPREGAIIVVVSAPSHAVAASSGAAAIFDTLESFFLE